MATNDEREGRVAATDALTRAMPRTAASQRDHDRAKFRPSGGPPWPAAGATPPKVRIRCDRCQRAGSSKTELNRSLDRRWQRHPSRV